MSLLSSARTILIMSDEGLQIYMTGRLSIKHVQFITWDVEDFANVLKTILVKKCGKKPVMILNDMVEQHYRKERIPKVGFGDRGQIIKSRLDYVFPNNQIRAALKLNKNNKSVSDETPGHPYLFAAVPKSQVFNKTFNAIIECGVKFIGFYLLPIEGGALIHDLSKKLNKGNKIKSAWTIFVGQQSNGGLRQIVTRNGELALTRMTPIVDTDVEPEMWANEVSEELTATMSYLSRFGYKQSDGLDVFVVANVSTHDHLKENINIDADLRVMTVKDAADMLSVKIGMPSDMRYTDPLYAAYLGKKTKFLLPMQSKVIDGVTKPRQIASFLLLASTLAALYVGYNLFMSFKNQLVIDDSLVVTKQQIKTQENEYKIQAARSKELGFDFLVVDGALENYYALNKEKMDILPFVTEVGRSLGTDLTIDRIEINSIPVPVRIDNNGRNRDREEKENTKTALLNSLLVLSFPNTIRPAQGVLLINNLRDRLEENLPNYTVEIIRQVADLSYTGNVVGGTDSGRSQESEKKSEEDYVAEIRIVEKP